MIGTDKLRIGESLQPLAFEVTPELNNQILESIGCCDKRYQEFVHPSFLIGYSNITRSPSYYVDNGHAMHTHDEIEFINEAKVGDTLIVTWIVSYIYKSKNRKWQDITYQVVEAKIVNSNHQDIIKRRITDIFLRK